MELRHLRYFATVAEEMHFGRAARRLNMSQPPLSIQIRNLEQELGVELFVRKKAIQLTPAGREFLVHVRGVLEKVDQGVRAARRMHAGEAGELSLGFIAAMAYTWLPWQLREFRQRFPGVELILSELDTISQIEALRAGRLDLGIVRGPIEQPGLKFEEFLAESLVVALPAGHRLAGEAEVVLADLAGDPFIMFPRRVGGALNDLVFRLCGQAGFNPRVVQEIIQLHVVVSLVSAGIGIAIVPESTRLYPVSGVVFRPLALRAIRIVTGFVAREEDEPKLAHSFARVAAEVAASGMEGLMRYQAEAGQLPAVA